MRIEDVPQTSGVVLSRVTTGPRKSWKSHGKFFLKEWSPCEAFDECIMVLCAYDLRNNDDSSLFSQMQLHFIETSEYSQTAADCSKRQHSH